MAAAPGSFDYFRRDGIFPNGNTKSALDYFRVGEPIMTMGADASTSSYSATASGGMVLGNSATVQPRYIYTPSGGMVLAGDAAEKPVHTALASGNARLGGTVTANPRFNALPTGGMVLAGDAAEKPVHTALASGNARLGGTVTANPRFNALPTGGMVLGGTATTSLAASTYIVTASGGMIAGNSVTVQTRYIYSSTGSAVLGGSASANAGGMFDYDPSGGMVFKNAATVSFNASVMSYSASGAINAGGTADLKSSKWIYFARFGQFGISAFQATGGTADVKSSVWHYTASGGIQTVAGVTDVESSQWIYFARFGQFGVSAFRATGGTADVLTSYHEYFARFGQFGVSAFRVTGGTAEALGSYHEYFAQFGQFGASRFRVTGGTATIVAPMWAYTASGGFVAGGTVSITNYYGNYPALLNQPRLGSGSTIRLIFTPEADMNVGMVVSGSFDYGKFLRPIVGSGGIATGGTLDVSLGRLVMDSGGRIKTGDAAQVVRNAPAVVGNARFGGTAHAACSYYAYEAVPTTLGLYTPSYHELIDHQQPIGFWIKSDTAGPTLTNYGTLGVLGDATLGGSPVFGQSSWIPNQKDGNSMRFDWINTYAAVTDPDFLAPAQKRTVSMVFRLYDANSRGCLYEEGNSLSGQNLYVVNGNLIFHVWNVNPPAMDTVSIIVPINANQTYHVLATIDCLTNTMKLFLDGVEVGSEFMFVSPLTELPARTDLAFGAKYNGTRYNDTNGGFAASSGSPGTGHWTRGHIQAVAVWDRVLSETEILGQQNARAARYSSSVENIFYHQADGAVTLAGSSGVQAISATWSFEASGNVQFSGTTSAQMPIRFVAPVFSVGLQAGGNAHVTYDQFAYQSSGRAYFPLEQRQLGVFNLSAASSGNAVFGNNALVVSSNYTYQATGGVVFGNAAQVATFTLEYQPQGGMVLASEANNPVLTFTYAADGLLLTALFAKFDYTLEVERDITWNISRGVLRYYRVEGKPKPNTCPPVSGVCGPEQCVQYVINVSAHSVGEVCDQLRKLRFKGPVKRISVFSRPVLKTDEDPNVNYDCNELVDVAIPECDDLFLEYDLLVTAGATAYSVFTEDFAYFPAGGISLGGEADKIFNQWGYVASGGLSVANEETTVFYPGKIIVAGNGGNAQFGGEATYSTNALGTRLVTAGGTPSSLFTEVIFGTQSGGVLAPPDETVSTVCCGSLPSLLFMNHQMERFAKLDKFLFINAQDIRRNLRLVYSAKKNIWYNNIHFKGTGSSNDPETWDITTEFGCIDDLDGIPIQGTLWGFSFTVCNKNLRTKSDNYTRIVLGFDPKLVCTLDEAIDNTFSVNVRDQSTDPVVLRATVLYDEIGLFKTRAFIADPNIKFRVTSTPLASPLSNINLTNSLQEILL